MQKRLRNDELRVLRGEVEVDETHLDNDVAGLETSASEGELQPVRQAPANFVSVREQHSMHTTEKGAGKAKNDVYFQVALIVAALQSWYALQSGGSCKPVMSMS